MMERYKLIQKLQIFQNIASKTLEQLYQRGRINIVEKGTVLIHEREQSSYLYFQLSGKSIVYNLTASGKRKILFVLEKVLY